MKHSLFIKSHSRDFPWLEYCRDSIRRFCRGWDEIVLCLPEGESFNWPEAKIVHVRESFTGYLFQQAVKLYADQLCSGDFITFQDSDTIFTNPVTPETLKINEKPYWITRPYHAARSDQHVWRKPTSDFLGCDVQFEGMYRHPFTVPRSVLQRMRGFCQFQHGQSLDEYIRSKEVPGTKTALTFSEWNAVGAFAWFHCKDQFHWIDASQEEPPPAVVHQGFTWGGDERREEDLKKFREILGEPESALTIPRGGGTANPRLAQDLLRDDGSGMMPTATEVPVFTEASAIQFLADQVKNNFHKARIIKNLKAAWKGKPEEITTAPIARRALKRSLKSEPKGTIPITRLDTGFLLCIHSYPGANETMVRHWPNFKKAGATRIAGIGTTDGKCTWPDGLDTVVDLGENSYMKLKGKDDHLCRRLLDTVKWCLTQPEDRYMICEYDTLILRKFPHFSGVHAHLTGGQVNGSKTKHFYHNPWLLDRQAGAALVQAMEGVLPDSQEYPNNSPDLFFGLAVERAQIEVKCCFKLFTRNSLDQNGDLELACEAAVDGVHAIHGVKTEEEYNSIMRALKEQHLALSHVA